MSNFVSEELDDHKTELASWISSIQKLDIPECQKGVTDRFVRDCQTLIGDINTTEIPSAEDLCDYVNRKNSLEIQHTTITEELE